jgi:dephospho-CoA kinase
MAEHKTTVIGLTGSIAAGKSSVADKFREAGAVILDCDKVVAELYDNDAELLAIFKNKFPEAVEDNKISKKLIKEKIFGTPKFKELEESVHPLVRKKAAEFVAANQGKLIVLEIQMLFESGAINQPEYAIDYTVVVDAPYEQRFQRSKTTRDWLTEDDFKRMNAKQMSPEEKKARADFVIENSDGTDPTNQVREIIAKTKANGFDKAK